MDYDRYIRKCKKEMEKTLKSNVPHTVKILEWDDGDFEIIVTHGDQDSNLHIFKLHSRDTEVEYVKSKFLSSAVKEDAFGNRYYIPEELIKELNK